MTFYTFATVSVTILLMAVLLSKSLVLEGTDDMLEEEFDDHWDTGFDTGSSRQGKSMLKVTVRNTDCNGMNENGTCVTSKACKERRGMRLGSCSNGFGVCCRIIANCSGDGVCPIRFNGTRIVHTASEVGSWQYNVIRSTNNPRPDGVCQILVDFQQTILGPPNTDNDRGTCSNDRVAISGSITANPVVCGDMRTQKMYLDFGDSDRIVLNVRKTAASNNAIDIKINYIACRDRRVPANCLQYYTDRDQFIRSFGFPIQLNNQKYTICMQSTSLSDKMQLTPCAGEAELLGANRIPFSVSGDPGLTGVIPPWNMQNVFLAGNSDCPNDKDWIQVFGDQRMCGFFVPNILTDSQPFMMRVNFNENENIIPRYAQIMVPPEGCGQQGCTTQCLSYRCYCCAGAIVDNYSPGQAIINNCIYNPIDFLSPTNESNLQCRADIVRNIDDVQNSGFCFKYARL